MLAYEVKTGSARLQTFTNDWFVHHLPAIVWSDRRAGRFADAAA
jgi:hypothetical protein